MLPDAADTPTGLPAPEPSTVAELHAWLLAQARPLAARFDARNGTDRRTRNLQDALAVTPPRFRDFERAAPIYRRAAAALLAAGGASLLTRTQVLSVWAQVAAGLEDPAPVIDAAEQALADLAKDAPADDGVDLSEDLAERLRVKRLRLSGFLQWRWAQAMAERVAHRSDDAAAADRERAAGRAIAAAQDMAHAGRIECAGQAFALAGRLRRDQGRTEDALWCVESAVEAYTLVRGRDARAEAAGDLIELLRATGQAERADRVAADLTHW